MIEVLALPADGDTTTWEVRRDGEVVGTATTRPRRSGVLLPALDVPEDNAFDTVEAIRVALRDRDAASLIVDVAPGDPVFEAALRGRDIRLEATQMLLDLASPASPPERVTLRPMTGADFVGYRDQLVTAYAQDMVDAGAFTDPAASLAASEQSTAELLPDGVDTTGQHLWTAYDGQTSDQAPVGILWIAVEGPKAFIYDIEVREEQRRRGYGRKVLDAGGRAASDLGATTLGLNVFGFNEGALALYEQAGYATTERTFRIAL